MAMLANKEWYDLARQTNWTPSYVAEDEFFPPSFSGEFDIPMDSWETFDEPYKVTYRDYVKTQREKDVGAYSVKSATARAEFYRNADPGWKSILQFHFGAIPFPEYASVSAFARMTRFGKAPGMRNMATFGTLDETRHAQIQIWFGYEFINEHRAFDWTQKAPNTDNWVIISERMAFDDVEHTRDAVSSAIMTNFAFEQGFTNLQFIAFSADAKRYGDYSFATMLQTIQSDEARHSQIGDPLIEIMIANGQKDKAQELVDVAFWRIWKQFAALTGVSVDYYTPLAKREQSFKEFVENFICTQFLRNVEALGLEKPWYWDDWFLPEIDTYHHSQQIGIYLYRATEWWDPCAGVSPAEREWLERKYPGWNETYGEVWDVIIDNVLSGRYEKTEPAFLPMLCNMSGLELTGVPGPKGKGQMAKSYHVDVDGRRLHFNTPVEKWIYELDPERYAKHLSFIDRFVYGHMPEGPEGSFEYMSMAKEDRGVCGDNYRWAEGYRNLQAAE